MCRLSHHSGKAGNRSNVLGSADGLSRSQLVVLSEEGRRAATNGTLDCVVRANEADRPAARCWSAQTTVSIKQWQWYDRRRVVTYQGRLAKASSGGLWPDTLALDTLFLKSVAPTDVRRVGATSERTKSLRRRDELRDERDLAQSRSTPLPLPDLVQCPQERFL